MPVQRVLKSRIAHQQAAVEEQHKVNEWVLAADIGQGARNAKRHGQRKNSAGALAFTRQPVNESAAAPEMQEQGQRSQREDKQIQDEPKMGRGKEPRISCEVAANPEVVQQESRVGTGIARVLESGDIGLGRHDDQHAKHKGDKQPAESFPEILAARAELQGIPAGRAGKKEQQGHIPHAQKTNQVRERRAQFGILDIIGFPEVKKPGGMKRNKQPHHKDAQPVNVISPVRFIHERYPKSKAPSSYLPDFLYRTIRVDPGLSMRSSRFSPSSAPDWVVFVLIPSPSTNSTSYAADASIP